MIFDVEIEFNVENLSIYVFYKLANSFWAFVSSYQMKFRVEILFV
jgi:hypothetical protein